MTRRSRHFGLSLRAFRSVRPALEVLEDRATPALIAWTNPAGGAWDDPSNWDLGRTPQPDDDVVIRNLDSGAVLDHASGSDTVQSITSEAADGTLAVSDGSSLMVSGTIDVPNLAAVSGGMVTGSNTGSLGSNLRAEDGGEIHFPAVTDYHATASVFTSVRAVGAGSMIDLPALTSLMATTGDTFLPGEVRLDLIADQNGTINLPALTSVRGHPLDYFIGYTALQAVNGGTFLLDPNGSVTFAAAGSLHVGAGSDLRVGTAVVDETGTLTVDGSLEAAAVVVQDSGSVTVGGTLTVSGGYTMHFGDTFLEGGTVTVGDSLSNQSGEVDGSGVINGDVENDGILSVTTLTINGNYTQTAAGQLNLRLRSASDFDQLLVSGLATLDGTLSVSIAGGYHPQEGDQLQVIEFGTGSGTFASVRSDVPLFGLLYVFQPRDGYQPGVTLLF